MNDALTKYADVFAVTDCVKQATENSDASAFIISGEDGDALCVVARLVAARLCGIDKSRAFDDHADIAVYPKPRDESASKNKKQSSAPKRPTVTVDDVREITDSLYLTPFELNKRVYIIEEAESMSEICQNKLLKSLEEPPPRVCFILCASGALLPTVESRCRTLRLPSFSTETVESLLSIYYPSKNVHLASRASRGNIGFAERIIGDGEFGSTYAAALKILSLASGSKNFAKCASVYDKFTREKTDAVLDIAEYLLGDVARLCAGVDTVFDRADVQSVSIGFDAYAAAVCAEYVREAARHNKANCMPQAVMDELVLKIMQEKAQAAGRNNNS